MLNNKELTDEKIYKAILNIIKYSGVGMTCEQIVDAVRGQYNDVPPKKIRELVSSLINNPNVKIQFGYIYFLNR